MRIGLVSDTHGNVDALERALETFVRADADRVFFLGACCADLDAALARRRAVAAGGADGALRRRAGSEDPLAGRIVRVASRRCREYETGMVDRKHVDLLEGQVCSLVHDKAELTRDDIANATFLFHGNSERAALVQIGPRCFVTPGHLRAGAPAESPGSFGLVELGAGSLELRVLDVHGAEVRRERADVSARSRLSVKS